LTRQPYRATTDGSRPQPCLPAEVVNDDCIRREQQSGRWHSFSSIPQARHRLRGVPALLAEQKNRC
jgi:hypothetical protein